MDISPFAQNLGVANVVNSPTRQASQSTLDLIVASKDIANHYNEVKILPPLQSSTCKSDHNVVLAKGFTNIKAHIIAYEIFDLRKSNIDAFVNHCAVINWSSFYKSKSDVNIKCKMFYELLSTAIATIPIEKILISSDTLNDNFITPTCISIANKRDLAYSDKNMTLYNHYKLKYNNELTKCKKKWTTKLKKKNTNIWNVTKHLSGSGKTNLPMTNLINNFDDINSCTTAISEKFASVFAISDSKDISVRNQK